MPVLHYKPIIGGMELFIKNLAERLSDQAEIWVITGRVKGRSRQERDCGVRILRTSPCSLGDLSGTHFFYIFTAWPFIFFQSWRLIKKERIDLLHCHGFFSGLIGWLLGRITKVPYIITVQGGDLNTFYPPYLAGIVRRLEGVVYRNAALCNAASRSLMDYFAGFGVLANKIILIPNGVDVDNFQPRDEQSKRKEREKLGLRNKYLLITVCRLEKVKGIGYLIGALPYLERDDFQLWIAGSGSQEEPLKKMVIDLGLKEKVKFLGALSHQDLPFYLSLADIFILPSLAEGFGASFLEAMACGLPVIGTPVGGIPDFLQDYQTGLFCQQQNSQSIAQKVIELLEHPALAQKLGQTARQLVLDRFAWPSIIATMLKVYYNCPKL